MKTRLTVGLLFALSAIAADKSLPTKPAIPDSA